MLTLQAIDRHTVLFISVIKVEYLDSRHSLLKVKAVTALISRNMLTSVVKNCKMNT